MFEILFAGAGGGILRGIVGYMKHTAVKRGKIRFSVVYFGLMMVVSGLVGVGISWALFSSGIPAAAVPIMAFVEGYAGGDFVENIYEIVTRREI